MRRVLAVAVVLVVPAVAHAQGVVDEVIDVATHAPGWEWNVHGRRYSTRNDRWNDPAAQAFAKVVLPDQEIYERWPSSNPGLRIEARAVGVGNVSEISLDGELVLTEWRFLHWSGFGPFQLDVTGPGVDYHVNNAELWGVGAYNLSLFPGTYHVSFDMSLESGDWPKPGHSLVTDLGYDLGTTRFNLSFSTTPVPEPSTWLLAAVALLGALGLLRRHRRKI